MDKSEVEFLGLRRNALVFTITSFFLGIGTRISSGTFLSQYARYLGAPILILGLFGTIQGLIRVILVAPLGYLSDRIGYRRKWIVVAGDVLCVLAYFIYASASSWIWLILGLIFESGIQVVNPVGNAMVADSINPEKRGMAIAARNLTIMLPSTFAPVLGGIFLDSIGMEKGMPLLFIIGGLFRLSGTLVRAVFLKEEKGQLRRLEEIPSGTMKARIRRGVSDMFNPLLSMKTLRTMAIVSLIGAAGLSVVRRFQAVYVTEVLGLTNAEWGFVTGTAQAVGAILRIPIGKLTDILGRRKCILIDYIFRPIYFVGLANATNFSHILFLNTLYDLSGEAGSPAWQALMMDLTPRGSRGRTEGSFAMVTGLTDMFFPTVGAFLWEAYGPEWSFYLCGVAESIAVLTIFLFLKEPKHREI